MTVTLDGTGDITTVAANRADLVVNTAGTHTAITTQYWDDFTMTAGTFVGTGQTINVAGDALYTAGTCTGLTIVQSGTANYTGLSISWNTTSNHPISYATGTYDLITMADRLYADKAVFDPTGSLAGATRLYIYENTTEVANNFLDVEATVDTGNVEIWLRLLESTSNAGTIRGKSLHLIASNDTLTQTGPIYIASTTALEGAGGTARGRLLIGVDDCTLGAVTLGLAGAAINTGQLDLGVSRYGVTIASIASSRADQANFMRYGDGIIRLSGTIDGTSMTSESAATGGLHAEVHGGTMTDVTLATTASAIDATNSTDGGDNSNIIFSGTMGYRSVIGGGMMGSGQAPWNEIRIGLITDTHNSDDANGGNRWYSKAEAKIQDAVDKFVSESVDYIVHLGDSMNDQNDGAGSPSDMDDAVAIINANSGTIPVLWAVGNHDILNVAYDKDDWLTDITIGLLSGQDATYFYKDVGNLRLFVLDPGFSVSGAGDAWPTGYDPADAWLSAAQLTSLATDLAAADATGKYSIIFMHYGAGIYSDNRDIQNAATLRTELAGHRVIAVVSGHMHIWEESRALGNNSEGTAIRHIAIEANVDSTGWAAHTILVVNDATGLISLEQYVGDSTP